MDEDNKKNEAPQQSGAADEEQGTEMEEELTAQAAAPESEPGEGKPSDGEEAQQQDSDSIIAGFLKKIETLEAERDANLDMAKRQMADFANYRRRTEKARLEADEDGRRDAVKAFLPVMDNLERALEAAKEDEGPLRTGVELVCRQMTEAFHKLDVTAFDPLGEPFDAKEMDALMQGTAEDGEPGTVCQVFQKGYRMGKRILRHATVKAVAE